LTDGEGSAGDVDDQEVTDECAMLIHTDHMHKHTHIKPGQDKTSGITDYNKKCNNIIQISIAISKYFEKTNMILYK